MLTGHMAWVNGWDERLLHCVRQAKLEKSGHRGLIWLQKARDMLRDIEQIDPCLDPSEPETEVRPKSELPKLNDLYGICAGPDREQERMKGGNG